uniref:CSON014854 protein n=1 Tax=Culicoides sonorensis TaxID=179676 RepID=A0A336MD13_CULSO
MLTKHISNNENTSSDRQRIDYNDVNIVLKGGFMIKRSQNKKRFTSVNYKRRWFEINLVYLHYFDVQNDQKRKERGRIDLRGIRVVEPAVLNSGTDVIAPEGFPFQIGYCETSGTNSGSSTLPQYTLYVLAPTEKERTDWIRVIRKACEEYTPKSFRYHPGIWLIKKWSCCKSLSRTALGCQVTTQWPETNNNPNTSNSPAQTSLRSSSPSLNTATNLLFAQNSRQQHHNSSSSLGNTTPTSIPPQQQTTLLPTMPGGTAPGTPISKTKDGLPHIKVVVALYPFKAIETGDLSLEKNAEYEVIDDSQEHWWKVKDQHGNIGYIPSNYVKEKELLGLSKYDWYVGDMSRQRAESLLKQNDKEGCFVVRKSSTKGLYTLSLHTKCWSHGPEERPGFRILKDQLALVAQGLTD